MLNQDTKKEYFQTFLKHDDNHEALGDYSLEKEEFLYTNIDKRKLFITIR